MEDYLNQDMLSEIYTMIKDNEALNLADGQKITVALLNPILLAIKHKSLATLKYLVEVYGNDLR